jgi:hypothetical protein
MTLSEALIIGIRIENDAKVMFFAYIALPGQVAKMDCPVSAEVPLHPEFATFSRITTGEREIRALEAKKIAAEAKAPRC